MTATLNTQIIENIPCLMIQPQVPTPCPVVFYVCGFHRNKEEGLALGVALAQRGIACVSFDPLYHGERFDTILEQAADPTHGGIYPLDSGLDTFFLFLKIIRQCAGDIQTLLTSLRNDPRLDITRSGVCGMSMGAYASYLAFADIPELRAAIPMMGVPTFTLRWLDLLDECAFSNPAWGEALRPLSAQTQVRTQEIGQFDPANRLPFAAPRALLAMSGDFDSDQPKHYVLQWLRGMQTYNHHLGNLQWKVYPVGHTVTAEMIRDAVDWFVRYLGWEES